MLGGPCLNIGCAPSRNLLAAAAQRHGALSNRSFPMVPTSAGKVDLPALTAQKQNLIESMRETKYAAVLLFCGLSTSVGNVAFSSLLQSQFLEELRGRAVGGLDVLWQTRRLLSLPGGGLLADAVGTRAVYLLLLVATAVGAAGARRTRRQAPVRKRPPSVRAEWDGSGIVPEDAQGRWRGPEQVVRDEPGTSSCVSPAGLGGERQRLPGPMGTDRTALEVVRPGRGSAGLAGM